MLYNQTLLTLSSSTIIGFIVQGYRSLTVLENNYGYREIKSVKSTLDDINYAITEDWQNPTKDIEYIYDMLPGGEIYGSLKSMKESYIEKLDVLEKKFSIESEWLPIKEAFKEALAKTAKIAFYCMFSTATGFIADHFAQKILKNSNYDDSTQKKLAGLAGSFFSLAVTLYLTRSCLLSSAVAINYAFWHR